MDNSHSDYSCLQYVDDRMTTNLTTKSDGELRALLQASRQMLAALTQSLVDRPDMQEAVSILMRPDDMLETFSGLAVKDPDLMRLVLQASVAALVNVQSVEATEGMGLRRAEESPIMACVRFRTQEIAS